MKLKHLSLSVMLLGTAFAGWSTGAVASGYHFGTQSVSAQATANASAAEAGDATTIFYNAAGMTKLDGTHFSGALNIVAPSVEYSNARAFYPSGTPAAVSGVNSGKITDDVLLVPHLYLTHKLNDRISAGLGVYVPYASATEYQRNSVLRYNLNETSLTTIDINPTIAFKLNEQHSFAAGVIAQYAKAELRQYANFGARLAAINPAFTGAPTNGAADGYADVDGDDWGFGYNLAWLWDINEKARVGLNYRSAIKHNLQGNAKWSLPTQVVIGGNVVPLPPSQIAAAQGALRSLGYAANESASVEIKTPESLSLHGMYMVDSKWNVFGDVTWTKHSHFDRAEIKYGNKKPGPGGLAPVTNVTVLTPKWDDTYKVSLGASYQYNEPLQLRFGVAYDQTPVQSDDLRLATMPDNDRYWFSVGAKYDLNKNSSINVAYSYIHIKDAKANVNGYCGGAAPGAVSCVSSYTRGSADFKSHANILGVQYNHSF